jgi:hypothetical protein
MKGVEEQAVVVLTCSDSGFVQSARIQCDPSAVSDPLDAVGNDQMSVKLRISHARLPMVKGCSDGATGAEMGNPVPPGACVDGKVF